MTYFEKSIENFLEQLAFDSDFYDVYSHSQLLEYAQDFIQSYEISIEEGCDGTWLLFSDRLKLEY